MSLDWDRLIREAIEAADASQIEVLMAPKEPRDVYLSPSGLGKCPRYAWYKAHGVPGDEAGPRSLRVFRYGDFMEALFLDLLQRGANATGVPLLVVDAQRRVWVGETGVHGSIDAVLEYGLGAGHDARCLMDCKTTTSYGFEKHERGYDPEAPFDRGYLLQLACYRIGRREATGSDVDAVGILEINKETAEYRFHDLTDLTARLEPVALAAIAVAQGPDCPPRLPLKESTAKTKPPPKIDIPCVWGKGSCDYAQRCWGTRAPGARGSCGSCGGAIDAPDIAAQAGPEEPVCARCEDRILGALSA